MGRITNPYILTALACTGGLLFGFDISSMSGIISSPNYLVYFGDAKNTVECPDRPGALCNPGPSADVQGGITASMAGGSFIASLFSGLIADRFGRRAAIFVGCCFWILRSIITCAVQNIAMLIVGHTLNGMCVGLCSAQVPVYLSELSPSRIRGRLVGCQQWAITWGIMLSYWASVGCGYLGNRIDGEQDGRGTASFRAPWGIQMIPAAILMAFVPLMPESPRWLMAQGRNEEALEILAQVHAKGDQDSPLVQAEYREIKQNIEESSGEGTGYIDLFRHGNAWRTHIAMFTQIWSQLTGMNVMMYYLTYVFQMAGITGNIALISNGIQYVINVVMTVPALLYIDRWGRRPTLLVGTTLMIVWLFAVAGLMANYGHYYPDSGNSVVRWKVEGPASKAVIACSYLFVASFASSYGVVSWVYVPELFGNRLRGKSNSVATASNWAFNFALGYFVPPAFHNIQWKSYIIFGCFTVAMTIHIFFAFPETAGKTLEEVDEIFESGIPAWKTKPGSSHLARDIEAVKAEVAFTQHTSTPGSDSADEKELK
ncbi:probable High-affinity glucose transporter [Sporisorium reilianum f. sp. reilianum]|uniref:Probable High-affinity glucose transporter n=1 Tax=Sporisorium reilianum f. sp. reilianum TaxID=72559 RepID=A0A2N8UHA6_9BASI|nr:probable High-affinity glucose transporter [Sporisorium reilianum f. sp. reilianum]